MVISASTQDVDLQKVRLARQAVVGICGLFSLECSNSCGVVCCTLIEAAVCCGVGFFFLLLSDTFSIVQTCLFVIGVPFSLALDTFSMALGTICFRSGYIFLTCWYNFLSSGYIFRGSGYHSP